MLNKSTAILNLNWKCKYELFEFFSHQKSNDFSTAVSTSSAQIVVFKYRKKSELLWVMNDSISGVKNIRDDLGISSCNRKQENCQR